MSCKPILSAPQASTRLPGRNRLKADILEVRADGRRYAVKSFRDRPWWVRTFWAPFWVRRERRALRLAAAVDGVPRLAETSKLDSLSLRMEWLEGLTVAESTPADPRKVLHRLRRVIDDLHRAGIAHGDLHHRDILLSPDQERVYVVDFATAIVALPHSGPLRRSWFERMRDQDRIAVARLEARWTGADEQAAIDAVGERAARRYRSARRWKSRWDRLRGKR